MLSIEVACIGLEEPIDVPADGFEIIRERGLQSHRVPSRFQGDFDAMSGCLYHLGKTGTAGAGRDTGFSAYEILGAASRESFPASILEFAAPHVTEVQAVLSAIVSASPLGQALFTSDWEYGPDWTHRFGPLTLSDFWKLHASRNIYLNTAYALVAEAGT